MKSKNLLHAVAVLLVGQMLFGCSSAEYYRFSATKPEAYNTAKDKPAPAAEPVITIPVAQERTLAAVEEQAVPPAPVLEASTAAPSPAVIGNKTAEVVKAPAVTEGIALEKREMTVAEAEALTMAKERLADMTKAEKKDLKREMKEAFRQSGGGASIVEIILAILLPPLAVFLHDGIDTSFWISVILTLLFWVPGVIYALLVVTDTI
ncbi:YqaE/Pmp3 family membrane protein [Pontibacter russatus]|uniref:YqaE/Pmp3 family membrane protein n=1 Tax=Pontibacter russatus TaxID=2694929 RepID=UPI001F005936|nr:YqaE/Pmp3 family membrane protein [Pontibacter russatus]